MRINLFIISPFKNKTSVEPHEQRDAEAQNLS